jgi:glucan phosphoethanolaminetransferase (alkaline phosphatase superfamily)
MTDRSPSSRVVSATVVGASAILVSGWVHFYLYFRGGYREIAPESVLGLNISRSFAINAVAAVVLAEALVVGLRVHRLLLPAAALGAAFAAVALLAYVLSRTRGLLGFEESATTAEAVVAMVAEVVAFVALAWVAVAELRPGRAVAA